MRRTSFSLVTPIVSAAPPKADCALRIALEDYGIEINDFAVTVAKNVFQFTFSKSH